MITSNVTTTEIYYSEQLSHPGPCRVICLGPTNGGVLWASSVVSDHTVFHPSYGPRQSIRGPRRVGHLAVRSLGSDAAAVQALRDLKIPHWPADLTDRVMEQRLAEFRQTLPRTMELFLLNTARVTQTWAQAEAEAANTDPEIVWFQIRTILEQIGNPTLAIDRRIRPDRASMSPTVLLHLLRHYTPNS